MDTAIKSALVLKSIGKSPFSNDTGKTVSGEETDQVVTKWPFGMMVAIALVAIGSGVASMILTTSWIVDVACACLYIVAPIAVVQKIKLSKLGTLRTQQNRLRESVNRFALENTRLSNNLGTLNTEVTSLKGVSADLAAITKKTGGQTDRLVSIVKENGEIQAKVKKHLEMQVMQSVLSAVLKSDTDEDFSISADEIPRMQLRLGNIPGITFDKANFDKHFKANDGELKLKDIMAMLHNLKDDIPEKDNIFHYDTKQLKKQKSILGF